jgi:hypothetical protein
VLNRLIGPPRCRVWAGRRGTAARMSAAAADEETPGVWECGPLSGHDVVDNRVVDEQLEMLEQPFATEQQTALLDGAGAKPAVD